MTPRKLTQRALRASCGRKTTSSPSSSGAPSQDWLRGIAPQNSNRLSAGLLAGFAAIAAIASPALAKALPPPKSWKAATASNLRSQPSSRAPSIAVIPRNTLVAAPGPCEHGWCPVDFKGKRGWVYKPQLVEAAQKPARAPVVPERPALPASLETPRAPAETLAPSAPEETAGVSYSVIGLSASGVLPMREGPLDSARVVDVLPSSATGIADLKTSVREWRLVEHNGVKGYVQSRFLARSADAPTHRYSVEGMEGLKVFNFGGADAVIVGEIPFYAAGIVPVGDCNAQWCHVRYLGLVGFVDARGLHPDADPEG
jgi:SH3-like domain-containing protein